MFRNRLKIENLEILLKLLKGLFWIKIGSRDSYLNAGLIYIFLETELCGKDIYKVGLGR